MTSKYKASDGRTFFAEQGARKYCIKRRLTFEKMGATEEKASGEKKKGTKKKK